MIKTIFILDDQPFVSEGLEAFLEMKNYRVTGKSKDGDSLLYHLMTLKPDVLIMEINLVSTVGITLMMEVKELLPRQNIIIYTSSVSQYYQYCSLQFGVNAYVLKRSSLNCLLEALEAVDSGQCAFPPSAWQPYVQVSPEVSNLMDLSRRELTVLIKILQGHSNMAISRQLGLSNKTVSAHRMNVQRKLGFKGIRELSSDLLMQELT